MYAKYMDFLPPTLVGTGAATDLYHKILTLLCTLFHDTLPMRTYFMVAQKMTACRVLTPDSENCCSRCDTIRFVSNENLI